MKRIINNKVYDTSTAKEIGGRSHGNNSSDFSYWSETLYQKRNGAFFLHGEGGPMTRYSKSLGQNSWGWGEEIIPMSGENAREWAEENLEPEKYEKFFGMPDEDAEKATLCIQLSAATAARLRKYAADNGISMSAAIKKALEAYLE